MTAITRTSTTPLASCIVPETASVIVARHNLWQKGGQINCKTGSLIEMLDGSILSCWYGGSECNVANDETEPTSLWLSTYRHGAWSEPRLLHTETGYHHWNPVFLQAKSGKIALFFRKFRAETQEPLPLGVRVNREFSYYVMYSHDQGQTFTTPIQLPDGITGPTKCAPFVLDDGTWIIPASKNNQIYIERTSDEGTTWNRIGPIEGQMSEPCLIPRIIEGTFRILARNRQTDSHERYLMSAYYNADDNFLSPAVPTEVPNPDSGIDACRLFDGRMLLVANPHFSRRSPLSVFISYDDGLRWVKWLDLEVGDGDYSQPVVLQAKDGLVHVIYSVWPQKREEKNIKHVVLNVGFS